MQVKQLMFSGEARNKLMEGVVVLAEAVGKTLGPRGKTVMMERNPDTPRSTKDGVTVAKEITLEDPWANMGAQMVKSSAQQTSDQAGDGTTTATIYAAAMIQDGVKFLQAGGNTAALSRGITKAVEWTVEFYERLAKPVEGVEQVAQVGACAANQDSLIGGKIAEAMDKVGKDGVVTVEEGGSTTEVETTDGIRIDNGYLAPHFATDVSMACELNNPWILVTDEDINNAQWVIPLLGVVQQTGRPLLLISKSCSGAALNTLIMNKRSGLQTCAVKAPFWGETQREVLIDLAIALGAKVLSSSDGQGLAYFASQQKLKERLNELVTYMGSAKRVVVTKDTCTFLEPTGNQEDIKARSEKIRQEVEDPAVTSYDREKLEQRLARLTGGVAKIKVGANSEAEMKELKDRVEDALHACRAAVEEGILPGGAVMPYYASKWLVTQLKSEELEDSDEVNGVRLVINALKAPIRTLARNADRDPGEITVRLDIHFEETEPNLETDFTYGWNAATDVFGDMVKMGVLVPLKVERIALESAASVARLVLNTEVVISDKREVVQQGMPEV